MTQRPRSEGRRAGDSVRAGKRASVVSEGRSYHRPPRLTPVPSLRPALLTEAKGTTGMGPGPGPTQAQTLTSSETAFQ